jgi:putative ABC transport system ATP-binding protein
MKSKPFIQLENLSKSYQEGSHTRVVLHDVNAAFARGEFAAIVGRSGTGKSTLLNIISGIDRADSGHIWLDGHDLMALNERARTLFRRQNIGFVFQFFNLIPTLTVRCGADSGPAGRLDREREWLRGDDRLRRLHTGAILNS